MKKIIIISISLLFLAGCSFSNDEKKEVQIVQENKTETLEKKQDFVSLSSSSYYTYGSKIVYWDFTSDSKDFHSINLRGIDKDNFYILRGPTGSGGFMSIYIYLKIINLFLVKKVFMWE